MVDDKLIKKMNTIKKTALKHFSKTMMPVKSNFFIYNEMLPRGQVFSAGLNKYTLNQDTFLGFVDKVPGANWGHPCQYIAFDKTGGIAQVIEANMPPKGLPGGLKPFVHHELLPHEPDADLPKPDEGTYTGKVMRDNIPPEGSGERYAILFSGMTCHRHLNDLEFLYRTLIDIYGFYPENISVLSYMGDLNHWSAATSSDFDAGDFPNGDPQKNGDPWPGDKTEFRLRERLVGHGSIDHLSCEIENLADKIKADDMLFIHTTSHGDFSKEFKKSYIYTWDDTDVDTNPDNYYPYLADGFSEELDKIQELDTLLIMMEQCYSGGFADFILPKFASKAKKTCFMSSVDAAHYSWGTKNSFWNYFARDWTSDMNGKCPYGAIMSGSIDEDGNYRISAYEAFWDAKRRAFVGPNTDPDNGDFPIMKEQPTDCSKEIYLGPMMLALPPRITGIDDVWHRNISPDKIPDSPDIMINRISSNPGIENIATGGSITRARDNAIYLRVTNNGTLPMEGRAAVYLVKACKPRNGPAKVPARLIGEVDFPAVPPKGGRTVGPITWPPTMVPEAGNYFMVASIMDGVPASRKSTEGQGIGINGDRMAFKRIRIDP